MPDYNDAIHFSDLDCGKRERRRREREAVFTKFQGRCMWCDQPYGPNRQKMLEHILPVSKHQHLRYSWANLGGSCKPCNEQKSNSEWKGWYSSQPFFNAQRAAEIEAMLREWDIG